MTRIVLTFDELEFARLAGAASARDMSVKEYIKFVLGREHDRDARHARWLENPDYPAA